MALNVRMLTQAQYDAEARERQRRTNTGALMFLVAIIGMVLYHKGGDILMYIFNDASSDGTGRGVTHYFSLMANWRDIDSAYKYLVAIIYYTILCPIGFVVVAWGWEPTAYVNVNMVLSIVASFFVGSLSLVAIYIGVVLTIAASIISLVIMAIMAFFSWLFFV